MAWVAAPAPVNTNASPADDGRRAHVHSVARRMPVEEVTPRPHGSFGELLVAVGHDHQTRRPVVRLAPGVECVEQVGDRRTGVHVQPGGRRATGSGMTRRLGQQYRSGGDAVHGGHLHTCRAWTCALGETRTGTVVRGEQRQVAGRDTMVQRHGSGATCTSAEAAVPVTEPAPGRGSTMKDCFVCSVRY